MCQPEIKCLVIGSKQYWEARIFRCCEKCRNWSFVEPCRIFTTVGQDKLSPFSTTGTTDYILFLTTVKVSVQEGLSESSAAKILFLAFVIQNQFFSERDNKALDRWTDDGLQDLMSWYVEDIGETAGASYLCEDMFAFFNAWGRTHISQTQCLCTMHTNTHLMNQVECSIIMCDNTKKKKWRAAAAAGRGCDTSVLHLWALRSLGSQCFTLTVNMRLQKHGHVSFQTAPALKQTLYYHAECGC